MKTTTFENAKPGDRVWDIRKGWGTIVCNLIDDDYPIEVNFDNESNDTFTLEGKAFRLDLNPTLFWDELKFVVPEQPPSTKLIHGVKVPDISIDPKTTKLGWRYYYPEPSKAQLFDNEFYGCSVDCMTRLKNNLCYPFTDEGKEAAILHAKAMLGIS
jgi:hypothetical protein